MKITTLDISWRLAINDEFYTREKREGKTKVISLLAGSKRAVSTSRVLDLFRWALSASF